VGYGFQISILSCSAKIMPLVENSRSRRAEALRNDNGTEWITELLLYRHAPKDMQQPGVDPHRKYLPSVGTHIFRHGVPDGAGSGLAPKSC
jgi:hypothetical protein